MKPKIFIGSSVEGLSVAYAIQQNLTHDAEATVWDQGVFALSKTTIESLNQVLESVDFGIFVFSPDDETVMRGEKSSSVRDNVLFELGLFIGKLGRDRVFFVVPDGCHIHIPTDLLGIAPGKYNPNREDKSFQAATGATCNQIRIQIKKLGSLKPEISNVQAGVSENGKDNILEGWIGDFINKKFIEAKQKLEKEMTSKSGDDLLKNEAWLAYLDFKIGTKDGVKLLTGLAEKYKDNSDILSLILLFLTWENYEDLLITIAEKRLAESPSDSKITVTLSECYVKLGEIDKAINLLSSYSPEGNSEIAIALAEIHKKNNAIDKAIQVTHSAFMHSPRDETLMYRYARLLQDNEENKEALYLFNQLTIIDKKNTLYWGYLGNACLSLDLYDKAMVAYRTVDELSKSTESWILHNIGNILRNKGLYTDAISWLNKGLAIDPSSEYAHERLSTAIKGQNEEKEKFFDLCKEGLKLIRNKNKLAAFPNQGAQ